jgi:hypothetical protein
VEAAEGLKWFLDYLGFSSSIASVRFDTFCGLDFLSTGINAWKR